MHVGDASLSRLDFVRRRVRARARRRRTPRSTRRQTRSTRQDVAYILYTSGSTSTPKGVQLQHYALIENMWHIGERMHVTAARPALARGVAVLGARLRERAVQPDDAWRLRRAAGKLRAGRGAAHHQRRSAARIFYGMPNMVQAIAEHPDRAKLRHLVPARRRHARHARAVAAHRRSRRDGVLDDLRADRILRQLHRRGRGTIRWSSGSRPSGGRCPASTCASSIPRPARSSRAARSARSG